MDRARTYVHFNVKELCAAKERLTIGSFFLSFVFGGRGVLPWPDLCYIKGVQIECLEEPIILWVTPRYTATSWNIDLKSHLFGLRNCLIIFHGEIYI